MSLFFGDYQPLYYDLANIHKSAKFEYHLIEMRV